MSAGPRSVLHEQVLQPRSRGAPSCTGHRRPAPASLCTPRDAGGPSCDPPGTPARRSPARRPPCCGRSHASARSPEPARPPLSAHSFPPPAARLFLAVPAAVGLTSGVFLTRHQYAPRWRPMAAASGSCACPLGPSEPTRRTPSGEGLAPSWGCGGFPGGADGAPRAKPRLGRRSPHPAPVRSPGRSEVSCWDPSLPITPEVPT